MRDRITETLTNIDRMIAVPMRELASYRDVLRGVLQSDIECVARLGALNDPARLPAALDEIAPADRMFLDATLRPLAAIEARIGIGTSGPDWLCPAIEHLLTTLEETTDE